MTSCNLVRGYQRFEVIYRLLTSRCSSVSFVSDCGLGDRGSIPGRGKGFFLASAGWAQPPIPCVPVALSPGLKRGRGVTLITYPHLVPRSRMSRSYTSSSSSASMGCSETALLYLCPPSSRWKIYAIRSSETTVATCKTYSGAITQ
jgi:hypothetical protein